MFANRTALFAVMLVVIMIMNTSLGFGPQILAPRTNIRQHLSPMSMSLKDLIKDPKIAYGAGGIGLITLLVNRLSVPFELVTDVQSRADIISVIACSALVLNVLSEQDIVARDRDAVALSGYALQNPLIASDISSPTSKAVMWMLTAVMQSAPVTSLHIVEGGRVIGRIGVIGFNDNRSSFDFDSSTMPILKKSLANKEEIYLPDLQILPGDVSSVPFISFT